MSDSSTTLCRCSTDSFEVNFDTCGWLTLFFHIVFSPCLGGRSLIIMASSPNHTSSLDGPVWWLNWCLQPDNPIGSHIFVVLFLFLFYLFGQCFIFLGLDDGSCCFQKLGVVRGLNVLIRVADAGSHALIEAHAHITSCAAENIYLGCKRNYLKATVYRYYFKCLVYCFICIFFYGSLC